MQLFFVLNFLKQAQKVDKKWETSFKVLQYWPEHLKTAGNPVLAN